MDVLILGGTVFLGRALVESARARGDRLTLFNRGRSRPGLFEDVEQIHGDRKTDLALLEGRRWDVVIDTCGYQPGIVRAAAEKLAGAAERYIFISSISVYSDFSQPGVDETSPVATLPIGANPDGPFQPDYYGPLKALCEQAAEQAFPGRALNIRPGLIVGPHDPSDRFTYWPVRIAGGGEVLAPAGPGYVTQFIDARDLANWILAMAERGATGVFNATGPAKPLPLGELFEACKTASGSDARFTWVDEPFLLENGVQPWMELPLWVPTSDPDSMGMNETSIQKALNAGLTFRPVFETVRDTLAWARQRPGDYAWRAGLAREKEQAVLAKYHGT